MKTPLNQRMIERAVRAAHKAGYPPKSIKCHPDGLIVLCFGDSEGDPDLGLDHELEEWKRSNGNA